jgi:hypothetical protein
MPILLVLLAAIVIGGAPIPLFLLALEALGTALSEATALLVAPEVPEALVAVIVERIIAHGFLRFA